jgi:hypothetical protein
MEKKHATGKRLRLRKETLRELTPVELVRAAAGTDDEKEPLKKCTCTTDFSNECCGPNGSC